ncbi:uncharacterized protein K452DRAFT_318572 [Aplosporella prunicola CBS 121167]|uniref:Uncharacterized protein n=1 Tax=Aplosporella prunicola CBS 121167 TaxID=1176127 RepID=A0A6A6BF89_9PEZI|nr:uncharacterized protein K452DRAFT_318572 [Aplosporella prunicola CBS 121167]KAF2141577.1 hypothetical protein K452DRAFT_318572 [Aplosporella prunicola CBS 121167]
MDRLLDFGKVYEGVVTVLRPVEEADHPNRNRGDAESHRLKMKLTNIHYYRYRIDLNSPGALRYDYDSENEKITFYLADEGHVDACNQLNAIIKKELENFTIELTSIGVSCNLHAYNTCEYTDDGPIRNLPIDEHYEERVSVAIARIDHRITGIPEEITDDFTADEMIDSVVVRTDITEDDRQLNVYLYTYCGMTLAQHNVIDEIPLEDDDTLPHGEVKIPLSSLMPWKEFLKAVCPRMQNAFVAIPYKNFETFVQEYVEEAGIEAAETGDEVEDAHGSDRPDEDSGDGAGSATFDDNGVEMIDLS